MPLKSNSSREILHSEGMVPSVFIENRIVGEWLSSKQAALFLGVTENALRIMVCRGQIKYSKFGRRLRFRFKDVSSLISKRR